MKMMASVDINSLKDILKPMNQSGELNGEFKSEISATAFLADWI